MTNIVLPVEMMSSTSSETVVPSRRTATERRSAAMALIAAIGALKKGGWD